MSLHRPLCLLGLILLLPSASSAETKVQVLKDVAYLGDGRSEKLDLYLPERPVGTRSPALVWIHGGGWTGGTKNEKRALEICTRLAQAGYVAASIDYRLGDGAWPQNLLDCKNAVRFLRARAAEYGVDPARIAVGGGSAGGHLALMVGFTAGRPALEPEDLHPGVSSAVRAVIDMYGITNILTRRQTDASGTPLANVNPGSAIRVYGAKSADDPVLRIGSPVTHITPDSPPVLILHGRADTTVDYGQAEELARELKRHGVPHELVLLDGIGHTFTFTTWGRKKLAKDLTPGVLAFLERHLK